ncbi:predicted protein [Histoplasma capsulatum var. duboisii H88]|uniref:Predicted protein n=1 Tax=Ajellomyces capsulatus (strain H88) TaxID=544711 RepID=F0UTM4_AJEC8|nr:predicted protein [Histoplasma capsulatum var. duboisii H88]
MNTSRYSQNGGQTPRPRPFTGLRSHPGLLGITEAAGRCAQTPITKTLTDRKKSTFSLTINVNDPNNTQSLSQISICCKFIDAMLKPGSPEAISSTLSMYAVRHRDVGLGRNNEKKQQSGSSLRHQNRRTYKSHERDRGSIFVMIDVSPFQDLP